MFNIFNKSYRKSFIIKKKLKKLIRLIKSLDKLDWKIDYSKTNKSVTRITNTYIGIELNGNVINVDYNNTPVISIPRTMAIFEEYYNQIIDFMEYTRDDILKSTDFMVDYNKLDDVLKEVSHGK
jgi:hypothetical protein